MALTEKYKEYIIEFNEWNDKFTVIDPEEDRFANNYDSPAKARVAIDRELKQKFNPVPAIFESGWNELKFTLGKVTSVRDKYGIFVDGNKKRSREPLDKLFYAHEANMLKLESAMKIQAQIDKLKKERDAIFKTMEKIKVKDVIKDDN